MFEIMIGSIFWVLYWARRLGVEGEREVKGCLEEVVCICRYSGDYHGIT